MRSIEVDFVVDADGDAWFCKVNECSTMSKRVADSIRRGQRQNLPASVINTCHTLVTKENRRGGEALASRSHPRTVQQEQCLQRRLRPTRGLGRKVHGLDKSVEEAREAMSIPAYGQGRRVGTRADHRPRSTALGSSQTRQCPGDFCDYDVGLTEGRTSAMDGADGRKSGHLASQRCANL